MHFVRRAALRAASSSTPFITSARSINTSSSPFALRSKVQNSISTSVFRRFASDEAESHKEESSQQTGSVQAAIDSVTETASNTYESVKESVSDAASGAAAATGFGGRDRYNNQERSPRRDDRMDDRRDPRPERIITPSSGVYIGNLLFDVTAADLTKEFEAYGTIKSAKIAADARGLSKGFGYIEFETTEQATAAIEARHQTILEGRRLVVNYMAKSNRENKESSPPSKTLFIGNLAFEMSDTDLNKLFRDIRNVIDVRVAIDRRTGQPRGFAHADFVDIESAQKAQEVLANKEIFGRKLRVDFSAGTRERAAPSSASF